MNMEIAPAISANSDIKVSSSIFGLVEKVIYLPTNSKIKAFSLDYTVDDGLKLSEVMAKGIDDMKNHLSRCGVTNSVAIGNVRAEVCLSADGNFVLYQWFRFVDFQYQPLSKPICFTGEDVNVVRKLMNI